MDALEGAFIRALKPRYNGVRANGDMCAPGVDPDEAEIVASYVEEESDEEGTQ